MSKLHNMITSSGTTDNGSALNLEIFQVFQLHPPPPPPPIPAWFKKIIHYNLNFCGWWYF